MASAGLSENEIKELFAARKQGQEAFRAALEKIWSSPRAQNPPFPPPMMDLGIPEVEPEFEKEFGWINDLRNQGAGNGNSSR